MQKVILLPFIFLSVLHQNLVIFCHCNHQQPESTRTRCRIYPLSCLHRNKQQRPLHSSPTSHPNSASRSGHTLASLAQSQSATSQVSTYVFPPLHPPQSFTSPAKHAKKRYAPTALPSAQRPALLESTSTHIETPSIYPDTWLWDTMKRCGTSSPSSATPTTF